MGAAGHDHDPGTAGPGGAGEGRPIRCLPLTLDPLLMLPRPDRRHRGATLAPGAPVRLFPTRIWGGGVDAQVGRQYDVGPDGRFLINTVLDDAATPPITLLMNWRPEAKK